jgi:hypothetical protein
MNSVLDDPATETATYPQTDGNRQRDEDEVARRIEKGINDLKTAVSEKLEDGKIAAERLVRHGRYAMEDGLSELAHTIKRHPVSFLWIAFAAGAACGILISHSATRSETTRS